MAYRVIVRKVFRYAVETEAAGIDGAREQAVREAAGGGGLALDEGGPGFEIEKLAALPDASEHPPAWREDADNRG